MTPSYQRTPDAAQIKQPITYPEATVGERPDDVADPRPDGCPNCLTGPHQPLHVGWTPDGTGYYCTYRCLQCAHVWRCGWTSETLQDGTSG